MKTALKYLLLCTAFLAVTACNKPIKTTSKKLQVVTTTTMITDMAKRIGDTLVEVKGLMGSGVDPHLYKASEGDVSKIAEADVVFYNGLHLEGKLVDVFAKMKRSGSNTIALTDTLDHSKLIRSDYFKSNYDPHVWFNISYWKQMANFMTTKLSKLDPIHAVNFEANNDAFQNELNRLESDISTMIKQLPVEKRILVTAHDAFNYFGENYTFQVVGLQGLSTATEAGVKDVQQLSSYIISNKIKAIFKESSVPKRTIEALQEAVKAKGHLVTIGGTLFSDALGSANTYEGTYIGMILHNVTTIINALK